MLLNWRGWEPNPSLIFKKVRPGNKITVTHFAGANEGFSILVNGKKVMEYISEGTDGYEDVTFDIKLRGWSTVEIVVGTVVVNIDKITVSRR